MKPKHIILGVICVIAVALGIMFYFALERHNTAMAEIKHIPEILLTTIDGEDFYLAEVKPERKTVILFFSPDCEYCRKEIEGIISEKGVFDGIDWVFVTISPLDDLKSFLLEYPLDSLPGAKVCIEDFPELYIALDVTAPPSIFIYDANGDIEYYKRGAVSIKTILEWLK